ncbi:MAG: helix-turn-helix transcriptional regulator [Alphaproteobacteria bacterium]
MQVSKKTKRGRLEDGTANPIDIHVGNQIRLRRQMLKYSQTKLANLLGVTFQQIQKYELGKNRISASRLWDVANVLEVDFNFFYKSISQEDLNKSPRFIINQNVETPQVEEDPMCNKTILKIVRNLSKIKSEQQIEALEIISSAIAQKK